MGANFNIISEYDLLIVYYLKILVAFKFAVIDFYKLLKIFSKFAISSYYFASQSGNKFSVE